MNNDKKKTLVLSILGVALIGVGAFQFMPKGGSTPPAAATGTDTPTSTGSAQTTASDTTGTNPANGAAKAGGVEGAKKADAQREMLIAMGKGDLPKRDPFSPKGLLPEPETAVIPTPQKTVVANKSGFSPRSGGFSRPPSMGGSVQPLDPGVNPLAGSTNSGIGLSSGAPLRQTGDFAYTVKGVIVGDKPMAVFEDDGGNQRLVPLGGSVDRDTKIVGIEKGKVRIRHRGKDKTLNLPEGP